MICFALNRWRVGKYVRFEYSLSYTAIPESQRALTALRYGKCCLHRCMGFEGLYTFISWVIRKKTRAGVCLSYKPCIMITRSRMEMFSFLFLFNCRPIKSEGKSSRRIKFTRKSDFPEVLSWERSFVWIKSDYAYWLTDSRYKYDY